MKTETFKVTKKIIIAFIFLIIGGIMIISSFFIPDNQSQCNTSPITTTIFTSSFVIFAIGILFLIMGIALVDVEYKMQTGWIIKENKKEKKK